jgi:hypothetical protein
MSIGTLLAKLQDTSFATAILEGDSLFPWIESIHVLAVVTVVGTVSVVDLRLIGLRAHMPSAQRLMRQLLPMTWIAFAIALTTGFLLFSSKAEKYAANWPFRIKMLLLLCAGLNMAVFHLVTHRGIKAWDASRTPLRAKIAGGASLLLWIAIISFARWIGFTVK